MSLIPMVWYGVARTHEECGTSGNLFQFAYSADGEGHFMFFCPKCKVEFAWRIFLSQLQHDALCRDIVKCHPTKKVVPATPTPVIVPEDFSDEDLKLLKKMNIIPPKKEEE